MKAIIQRVKKCSVNINDKEYSKIEKGILVLLGITDSDTNGDIDFMINKIINLRIFPDEKGVMNESLLNKNYELMVVSNFTIYGNTQKGRRPSYINAAKPEIAKGIYDKFIKELKKQNIKFQSGEFQAMMEIDLVNDGPVTLVVESK